MLVSATLQQQVTRMATVKTTRARRAKGEGSRPRQRPNGRWEARFLDETGNYISRTFDTYQEATDRVSLATAARLTGDVVAPSRVKLRDFIADWLRTQIDPSQKLAPSTKRRYRRSANLYVLPKLGNIELGKLRATHVVDLQDYLRDTKGLRPGTIKTAHAVLSTALSYAVQTRLVPGNVAKAVARPSTPARTNRGQPIVPPTMADLGAVLAQLQAMGEHDTALAMRMTIGCGIRIGEAAALHWDDLILTGANPRAQITRNLDDETRVEGKTKSGAGNRTLALSPALVRELRAAKARRVPVVGEAGYVFTAPNRPGEPVNPDRFRYRLAKAQKAAKVRVFRWHEIRHAVISIRLDRGEPLLSVSRWAGHSRTSVTSDMYGHVETADVPAFTQPDELGGSLQ